ncbi:TonB-dependent siderophore receptor [Glaciimonas sp. GNP009]|uniref:TonB-dependent siderophore receptor n=2 Tax=Glaciimonas sp. CA11.2 TaxID=3048601 RepID=UPI002AB3E46F|nr:TonB-dependent siderophore receptor [Glaciimonas sp. CA11.2]MDY7547923.1 TonB-dependent siderophore receptor [Glaciimonas sp. CA11.2]
MTSIKKLPVRSLISSSFPFAKKLLTMLVAATTTVGAGVSCAETEVDQPSSQSATTAVRIPNTHELPLVTVKAEGEAKDSYRARSATVGTFGSETLLDTPASISVVTRSQLDDQQSRLLSDVVRNDASIDNNYTPLGYYENFSIRGFSLDLASSYQLDGMTISGEQNVALENKERVEVLKGLAGLQGGLAAPGGLINYISKRPADVASVTLGTDSRGSRYLATDVGTLFGDQKQFGLRVNAAHEGINTYVDGVSGNRNFVSVAADWVLSPSATLQFNIEDQHSQQLSVPGYQLLGGIVIPSGVSPYRLLGGQPWGKPVTMDSLNTNLRLDVAINPDWHGSLAVSRSRVIIDDNSTFPYGCFYVSSCGAGGTPPQYFSATGDVDVYDYRFPNDTRRNDQVQAILQGKTMLGGLRHDLTFGASSFRRTVSLSDGVNQYVGSDNIYNATPLIFAPSTDIPSSSTRRLDSRQQGLFALDRIQLSERWQILAGARQVWLRENAFDDTGATTRTTDKSMLLPQLALIYKPLATMTLYTSYSKGLTMGGQAPFWATINPSAFLPPTVSRQIEAGIKFEVSNQLMLSAAIFQMTKPYEYPKPEGADIEYVQEGTQTNKGIELSAAGQVTKRLRLTASFAGTQAIATNTGTPAYDGHQAINVPRLRGSIYADYAVPGIDGLNLLGGWEYSARKAATRSGDVDVPSVNVFNAGLRYAAVLSGHKAVVRLAVDNLLNKQYWKDVGEYLGDGYLHLGAPRTARLSVQYDF